MPNAFVLKLAHGAELTDDDRARLEAATARSRRVGAREDLIREGSVSEDIHLVLSGMACRYKMLPDGTRQIMAFLLPGDFCDLHVAILGEMDHSIGTLSPCEIVDMPREVVEDLTRQPNINSALWWSTLTDEGTLREWLVNMGRRSADRQMAHLFCELYVRLRAVKRVAGWSYDLPLTQEELGDTLGLSVVHVNRVLQQLREDGLIRFSQKRLTILDWARLEAFAEFNPNYLHLSHPGSPARGSGSLLGPLLG